MVYITYSFAQRKMAHVWRQLNHTQWIALHSLSLSRRMRHGNGYRRHITIYRQISFPYGYLE